MKTIGNHRSRFALAALVALGLSAFAPAALSEAQKAGLSYYSTFDDPEKGIDPELGEGTWNTTEPSGKTPKFITVSGSNRALDVASYNAWTGDAGQQVLEPGATAFTLVLRAKTGATAKGLLFAFGKNQNGGTGGLAFRRGATAGSFEVTVGRETSSPLLAYAPGVANDEAYRTYAVVCSGGALTLYVDGVQVGDPQPVGDNTVIDRPFQWGTRHSNSISPEAAGAGAIDALGVWTRALTVEEIAAIAKAMTPSLAPVSFDVPEGWTAKPVPMQAIRLATPSGTLELEAEPLARQTLGGRAANVADITGGTEAWVVYGISSAAQGDRGALERDVWLKVSGGAYDLVVGGKDNDWQSGHANSIEGDLFTELSGAVTARNVVGGITGCSDGGGSGERVGLPLTGNTLVAVGARLRSQGRRVTPLGGRCPRRRPCDRRRGGQCRHRRGWRLHNV